MGRDVIRRVLVAGVLVVCLGVAGATGASAQQPTLTAEDYGQWERLGAFQLDPTGAWLVVSVSRVDGDAELQLHRADGQGEPIVLTHGRSPEFSADGRWLVYRKSVSVEEVEASEERIEDRLGIVDLKAAHDSVSFDVRRVSFRDDGQWLTALGVPAADTVGADLIVMNPSTGARTVIGNVADFAWQDGGHHLAATLRTAWGSANCVFLFDTESGTLSNIASVDAEYRALDWREDSAQLAVLRSV